MIGDYCVIRPGACLLGPLTMGHSNVVHTGAVLGDFPQHLKFKNEPTCVEIGNNNVFREHVTIHRGTTATMKTVIGNDNFFMASSHIAHDCVVGDRCTLANGAVVGGHCSLADNVILSGNSAVHQFTRIGRLALLSGCSATSKDMPPFITQQSLNVVSGINLIGMKRAGMPREQISAVQAAFRIMFRDGLVLPAAIAKMEKDLSHFDAVQEIISFLRGCSKGINHMRGRVQEDLAA